MHTTSPPIKESPRVLHIDYPAAILRVLENTFQNRGFLWETADSGVQGLHLALVQNYDLILLSVRESTIDGLRVLRGLKRARITTPIVLLMPNRELELRKQEFSRYTNVLACIGKPIDTRQLEKVMEFLRQPQSLNAKDQAKLLETLARIERAVGAEV